MNNNVIINRDIDATPDQVWSVLADFANIAAWNGGVKTSYSTGGDPTGVGAQRHCDLAPMGELEETIVEFHPGEKMVISIDKAKKIPVKQGLMTFTMAPSATGTQFELNYRYAAKGGPLSGLVGRMLDGQLTKGFGGFIDDLEKAAKAVPAS